MGMQSANNEQSKSSPGKLGTYDRSHHKHVYNYTPIQISAQPTTQCGHVVIPAKYMQYRFSIYHHPKKPIWMEYNDELAAIGAFGLRPLSNSIDKCGQFCVASTRKIEWMMSFCIDCNARSYAIQLELKFNRPEFLRILIETYDRIEKGLPLKHQHLIAIQLTPCHRLHEIAFNIDLRGIRSARFRNYIAEEKICASINKKLTSKLRKAIIKMREKYGVDAICVLPKAIFLVEKRFEVTVTDEMIRNTGLFKCELKHDKEN